MRHKTALYVVVVCSILVAWPKSVPAIFWTEARKITAIAEFKLDRKGTAETLGVTPKVEAEWRRWGQDLTFGFTTAIYYGYTKIEAGDVRTKAHTYGVSLAKVTFKKIRDRELKGGPFLTLGVEHTDLETASAASSTEESFWSPAITVGIDIPFGKSVSLAAVYSTNFRERDKRSDGVKAGLSIALKSEPEKK